MDILGSSISAPHQELPASINQSANENKAGPSSKINNQKKTKLAVLFIGIISVIVAVSSILTISRRAVSPSPSNNIPNLAIKVTPTDKIAKESALIGKQIFIDYIPNFDRLDDTDTFPLNDPAIFPHFGDIRGTYSYKDKIVIVGVNKVVIYDPNRREIIKQNNELTCLVTAVVIGDYLYIGCNGDWIKPNPNAELSPSTLYKIEIDSGKIVNVYFGAAQNARKLTNIWLTSKGNILWGSSEDEVFRLDTTSDSFKFYSLSQLGFPAKCIAHLIYNEGEEIKVFADSWLSADFCSGGSIYDERNDSWSYFPSNLTRIPFVSPNTYIENKTKELKGLGVYLPHYFAISNRINNKYYLLTENELYVLSRNKFPEFLSKLNPAIKIENTSHGSRFRVNDEEKYAVFITTLPPPGGADISNTLAARNQIYLIDLNNGEAINLTENFTQLLSPNSKEALLDDRLQQYGYYLEEYESSLYLKEGRTENTLAIIDFSTKTLRFP